MKRNSKLKNILVVAIVFLITMSMYGNAVAAEVDTQNMFDFKDTQFVAPAKTGFSSLINRLMVSKHTPHHNGYDSIYTVNEAQVIEGKFQYGDFRKDLENEWVSIYKWSLQDENATWSKMGRAKTDSDGRISYVVPDSMKLQPGLHLIKLYVEGDGTQANMYIQVLDNNKKFVVFDIDGTLTTDDSENMKEYASELWNGNYIAKMYPDANRVAGYYASKGYQILYLSARPYWLTEKSQKWLVEKNFPMGMLHVYEGADVPLGSKPASFKADYLNILKSKGVEICYAYGNATTDVDAYYAAGMNPSNTFIIGKNAGYKGSTPISSYTEHLVKLP